jgi:hypothetical protein
MFNFSLPEFDEEDDEGKHKAISERLQEDVVSSFYHVQ